MKLFFSVFRLIEAWEWKGLNCNKPSNCSNKSQVAKLSVLIDYMHALVFFSCSCPKLSKGKVCIEWKARKKIKKNSCVFFHFLSASLGKWPCTCSRYIGLKYAFQPRAKHCSKLFTISNFLKHFEKFLKN